MKGYHLKIEKIKRGIYAVLLLPACIISLLLCIGVLTAIPYSLSGPLSFKNILGLLFLVTISSIGIILIVTALKSIFQFSKISNLTFLSCVIGGGLFFIFAETMYFKTNPLDMPVLLYSEISLFLACVLVAYEYLKPNEYSDIQISSSASPFQKFINNLFY